MSKIVVVGAGHGAGQLLATLRQKGHDGEIVLIGEEPWYPYQRPPLSKKFLAGELAPERLHFKPQSFYAAPGLDVKLSTRVVAIDRTAKVVRTTTGEHIAYDFLVLATGGRPRVLELPGSQLAGIHYLRTIDDVNAIRADMAPQKRLAIVGAGYIGLEVAAVAATLGLAVTVIETENRVMSRVVSPDMSRFYEDVHRQHGVKLLLSTAVAGFSGDDSRVREVILGSGERLPVDLVVIGIGIVPNTELAVTSQLEVDNGIVVDDHCRTSDPAIYAIGDCTLHPNDVLGMRVRLESVHNALEQARTAACNLCGEDVAYAEVPWFWSDQYDLKLQIAGLSQGYDETVIRGNREDRSFACLYLRKGELIAIDAINDAKDFLQAKALIAAHARPDREALADTRVELKDVLQDPNGPGRENG